MATDHEHVGARPQLLDQDSRLSPAGLMQLLTLAGKAEALELDLVLCSPLSRAIATAVDGLLLPPLPPPDAARPALGLGVVGRHPVEVRAGLGRIIFRSVPPLAHFIP